MSQKMWSVPFVSDDDTGRPYDTPQVSVSPSEMMSPFAGFFGGNVQFEKSVTPTMTNQLFSTGVGAGFRVDTQGVAHPPYPISRATIYDIAATHTALRLPIDVVVRETLINGFTLEPRFVKKCENEACGYEYTDGLVDDLTKCVKCGSTKLREPDLDQKLDANELLRKDWNRAGQNIFDVCAQLSRDIETVDDGYLFLKTEYDTFYNTIHSSQVQEIVVLHPPMVFPIVDNAGTPGKTPNNKWAYMCIKHRNQIIEKSGTKDGKRPKNPRCHLCGTQVLPAACIIDGSGQLGGTIGPGSPVQVSDENPGNLGVNRITVLADSEVIMSHGKYSRSLVYGCPIAVTCIQMLRALYGVETYFEQFFDRARPPKSLTLIGTRNVEMVRKQLDVVKERMRHDPYELPIIISPIDSGSRRLVEHINLTGPLSDLELSEVVGNYRRIVGAMYGIMPLYQGETENFSGDALEMAVGAKSTRLNQQFLEQEFLTELLTRYGITDWRITLKEIEVTDEVKEIQLQTEKAVLTEHLAGLGYAHERDDNGNFHYGKKPEMPVMDEGAPSGEPAEPSHRPNNAGTTPTGTPERKRMSDVGGSVSGTPGSGKGTSPNQR